MQAVADSEAQVAVEEFEAGIARLVISGGPAGGTVTLTITSRR
jgi:hypothetical protein